MSALVTIKCDAPGCVRSGATARTAGAARAQMRNDEWRLRVPAITHTTRDYCPDHAGSEAR